MPMATCKNCGKTYYGWALKWGKPEFCCDVILKIKEE